MQATVITFEVKRFAPGATNLQDVEAFIREHNSDRDSLTVSIDPTGIGDYFADCLESAGFRVSRDHIRAEPSSPSV
jgi:hypothetical protein